MENEENENFVDKKMDNFVEERIGQIQRKENLPKLPNLRIPGSAVIYIATHEKFRDFFLKKLVEQVKELKWQRQLQKQLNLEDICLQKEDLMNNKKEQFDSIISTSKNYNKNYATPYLRIYRNGCIEFFKTYPCFDTSTFLNTTFDTSTFNIYEFWRITYHFLKIIKEMFEQEKKSFPINLYINLLGIDGKEIKLMPLKTRFGDCSINYEDIDSKGRIKMKSENIKLSNKSIEDVLKPIYDEFWKKYHSNGEFNLTDKDFKSILESSWKEVISS